MKHKFFILLLVLVLLISSFSVAFGLAEGVLLPSFLTTLASVSSPVGVGVAIIGGLVSAYGISLATQDIAEQFFRSASAYMPSSLSSQLDTIELGYYELGNMTSVLGHFNNTVVDGQIDLSRCILTFPLLGVNGVTVGYNNSNYFYLASELSSAFGKYITINGEQFTYLFNKITGSTISPYIYNASTDIIYMYANNNTLIPVVTDVSLKNICTYISYSASALTFHLLVGTQDLYQSISLDDLSVYNWTLSSDYVDSLDLPYLDVDEVYVPVSEQFIDYSLTDSITVNLENTSIDDYVEAGTEPPWFDLFGWLRRIWEKLQEIFTTLVNFFERLLAILGDALTDIIAYIPTIISFISGYTLFSALFGAFLPASFVAVITMFIDVLLGIYIFRFLIDR